MGSKHAVAKELGKFVEKKPSHAICGANTELNARFGNKKSFLVLTPGHGSQKFSPREKIESALVASDKTFFAYKTFALPFEVKIWMAKFSAFDITALLKKKCLWLHHVAGGSTGLGYCLMHT